MTDSTAAEAAIAYDSPFGEGWVAFGGDEIVELGLPGAAWRHPRANAAPEGVSELAATLSAYWRGGPLPSASAGVLRTAAPTPLTEKIYREVAAIPAGGTMTYAAVAEAVGRPGAARAVGAAMAANRFAPIVPCHRVVGSDGSLRGYAGGVAMKRYLLDLEASRPDG